MNKFLTSIIIVITMLVLLAVPAQASERYIEKSFVFDGIAPEITIEHGLYGWNLTVKDDGSLGWSKNNGSHFLILPTDTTGCYVIREFTSEHFQRFLTYTKTGFVMDYPKDNGYGMQTFSRSQMFRLKWYTKTTCGGKTIRKCWKLVCVENNTCFCNGGWSPVKIRQDNWFADY